MTPARPLRILVALAVAGSVALATFGTAVAADESSEPVQLGIVPIADGSFFDISVDAGDTRFLTVALQNFGSASITATTYAADTYTLINGGFGAELDGEPRSEATTWLAYPRDEFELEARESESRTFTLAVPDDAPPGDYIAALVIESEAPVLGSDTVVMNQVHRQAIAVAVNVRGPRTPSLTIGQVSHEIVGGQSVVGFAIDNDGNAQLNPIGSFVLEDSSGERLAAQPVGLDSIYAGTQTRIELPLGNALPAGTYYASLSLADAANEIRVEAVDLELIIDVTEVAVAASPASRDEFAATGTSSTSSLNSVSTAMVSLSAWVVGILVAILVFMALRLRRSVRQSRRIVGR